MFLANLPAIRWMPVVSILLTACASSSFFYTYEKQAEAYRHAIKKQKISQVTKKISSKIHSADGLLYAQEAGRLAQLASQYKQSESAFSEAFRRYDRIDARAYISASKTGAQGLSLLGSENNIPYEGAAFERVYTHHFQAYNYLLTQNSAAASVELRRARDVQRRQELAQESAIAETQKKAKAHQVDLNVINKNALVSGVDQHTARLRSHFLSAYTYFFSAVFWEAKQQWNSARIDYKKAHEINPDNEQIIMAIERVQKKQPMDDKGVLVVLFEQGFIAQRQSLKISLPSPDFNTFLSIAMPYYDVRQWPKTQFLRVTLEGKTNTTHVLTTLSALAAKSLKVAYPALLARQVLRAVTKKQLQAKIQKSSDLGGVFANIYSMASEQADLRTWSTLPHTAQATRFELDEGNKEIFLNFGHVSKSQHILIHKGKTSVLRVIDAGDHLITQTMQI